MAKSRSVQHLELQEKTFKAAVQYGLLHQTAEDYAANGRTVQLNGQELVNFGSCSYLGLELDPRIKAGAIDAINRYGSQFASSRAYMSVGLYPEVEGLLTEMFDKPIILASNLTLGHQSSIPVLVDDDDVVILDHQVHASVTMATTFLRIRGVKVDIIRHSNLDMLESRIQMYKDKYKKIWYFADGIYSMFGDFAPVHDIHRLMDKYEQLHLYIDDAHGSGCMGPKGTGFVHREMPSHPRMYLTASLAKSFGTAGGVLVFPDEASRDKVRLQGGSLTFSGPIQPPMLGAAIASVKIHMSDELPGLQENLRRRIAFANLMAEENGLPFVKNESPICFINVGKLEVGYKIANRLRSHGYFVNLALYPGVPLKKTGLRLAINNHLSYVDIARIMRLIAIELPKAAKEENSSYKEIYKAFDLELV